MLPYLIAGAIGFGIAKLIEEDDKPKYAGGGRIVNNQDLIIQAEQSINEKMDELIGTGDYTLIYSEEQNRFIVSFREGDTQSSCKMADEVVDYVNIERNILRVGNCGKSMFWLTLID